MTTPPLVRSLREHADGALDQLRLHYGPLIRYIINPILTAREKMQTQKTGSTLNFLTLQDALQFFPPEEPQP